MNVCKLTVDKVVIARTADTVLMWSNEPSCLLLFGEKMEGETLHLFPTPVGKYSFRPLTNIEHQAIKYELDTLVPNTSNSITKNFNVLDSENLYSLKQDLTTVINAHYTNIYKPKGYFNLNITNSWCNVAKRGEHHHTHTHFNSILSAVLYLHVRQDDSIVFQRKDCGLLINTFPTEDTPFNKLQEKVNVAENDIVVFPSSLLHHVAPLERSGLRISLSFNTFFTGYAGCRETLSEIFI